MLLKALAHIATVCSYVGRVLLTTAVGATAVAVGSLVVGSTALFAGAAKVAFVGLAGGVALLAVTLAADTTLLAVTREKSDAEAVEAVGGGLAGLRIVFLRTVARRFGLFKVDVAPTGAPEAKAEA